MNDDRGHPIMLDDLAEMIRQGEPVPPRYREAVAQALTTCTPLAQALYVRYFKAQGAPLTKSPNKPGSAYSLAGEVFSRDASTTESAYRQYREFFEQFDADSPIEPDTADQSEEIQTDAALTGT